MTWRERLHRGLPLLPICGGDGGVEGSVGLDEPVTIDKRLDTRTHTQTVSALVVHREVMSVGDPTTDERIADVTNAPPATTSDGLVVWPLLTTPTATLTNVVASATSVTLQAANTSRKGLVVVNDSTGADLYVKLGATASVTSYTYFLPRGINGQLSILELPPICFTGVVDGIWSSASGNARVTELT